MRYELVSLVLVLAVAGGLLLGTGMPGGFFSAIFSPAQSSDDSQLSGDNAKGVDTSGFKVNMKASGSKTTGDDTGTDGQTDEIEEVTSPPITGMTGGGGGGSGSKDTGDDETINHVPVIEEITDIEIEEGRKIEFQINAEDSDGDYLTINVIGGPGYISEGNTYNYDVPCKEEAGEMTEDVIIEAVDSSGSRIEAKFSIKILDNRAYISISPVTKEVSGGDIFYVDVDIETEESILSVGFSLDYNGDVLYFTDEAGNVTDGGFLKSDASNPIFFGLEDSINIFHTRTGTSDGISGSGTLVIVYFTAIGTGGTSIDFGFADMLESEDGAENEICVFPSGGFVNVQ